MTDAVPTILLVDDEPSILRAYEREAMLAGVELKTAPDVASGVAAIEAQEFDAIISDYYMPDDLGIKLLQASAARQPTAKRCLTSAVEPPGLAAHELRGTVQHFFAKPFEWHQVILALGLTS